MKQAVNLTSDITRQLPSKAFEEASSITLDVPRDSVFKHLQVSLNGSCVTTFGSGTPLSDDTATMNRIINLISVTSNGSYTIKSVTPWMMHVQQLLANGHIGDRRASAGASATSYPTADAGFPYGSTTNITSVNESILISFENVLAGKGRMQTLWDTRGLASAEMSLNTNSFSNLLAFGNTAPVVYSSNLFQIEVSTVETQNLPQNVKFSSFKQTTKTQDFSAQGTDTLIDINKGNYLQGLMFEARDGASGGATTNAGKQLSNTLVEGMKLILNGVNYLQNTTFKQLQQKNKNRYGLQVPFSGNRSFLDGVAYMDLLTPTAGEKFGSLATAQNVQAPAVDQVQLAVNTSSSGPYTSVANLRILTNEIVKPVGG